MKKYGLAAAVVASLILTTAHASASILARADGLTTFGDQNREVIVDLNDDGKLSKGDVIFGYLRLDDIVSPGSVAGPLAATDELIVFSSQVASITQLDGTPRVPGQNALVTFESTTAAGLTLAALTGLAMPAGDVLGANFSGVALDYITSAATPNPDIFDIISEISSTGTMSSVAGLRESDDEWQSFFLSGAAAANPVDNLAGLATFDLGESFQGPLAGANGFQAGLSILSADSPNFLETVEFLGSTGVTTTHQLTITNGQVFGVGNADFDPGLGVVNPFFGTFTDQSGTHNFYGASSNANLSIDVVPEPTSVLLWLSGLAISIGANARCRRRA